MNTILIILVGITFAAIGQISWKLGMNSLGDLTTYSFVTLLMMILNPYIFLGFVLYGLGTIFWLLALSKNDLSFTYPFISLTYILILILSNIILKESIGINKLAGTILIVIGLIIITKA